MLPACDGDDGGVGSTAVVGDHERESQSAPVFGNSGLSLPSAAFQAVRDNKRQHMFSSKGPREIQQR